MNRKIYLIRHGKIDTGKDKCYIGITDLPLCTEGVIQAQRLKEFFKNIAIEKVYTSPLIRSVQTANIILEDRNIERELIKEFMEINMGQWEGKSFKYIKTFFPQEFKKRGENIADFIPPGGESFKQLAERVMPIYKAVTENPQGNLLIVAHAGVNRVILSNILSMSLENIFQLEQQYGCINEIYYDNKHKTWSWKIVV